MQLPVNLFRIKPLSINSHRCLLDGQECNTNLWENLACAMHLELTEFLKKPSGVKNHLWSVLFFKYSQGHSSKGAPSTIPGEPKTSKHFPLTRFTMKPSLVRSHFWSVLL